MEAAVAKHLGLDNQRMLRFTGHNHYSGVSGVSRQLLPGSQQRPPTSCVAPGPRSELAVSCAGAQAQPLLVARREHPARDAVLLRLPGLQHPVL